MPPPLFVQPPHAGTGSAVHAALESPEQRDYTLLEEIGKGAFSVVYKARREPSGDPLAVKVMDLSRVSQHTGSCTPEIALREVRVLTGVPEHPNVVKTFKALLTDGQMMHLVMEWCNRGELFDHIVSRSKYTEADAMQVMRQVMQAVQHLHIHDVIHRDIKPENVLVHQGEFVDHEVFKLSDFGLAKSLSLGAESIQPPNTVCGTPSYAAPEVWTGQYTHVADCFSAGVLMFVLLCGHMPLFPNEVPELQDEHWQDVSPSAIELMLALLAAEPRKRLSSSSALGHAWFQEDPPATPLCSAQAQLGRESRSAHFKPVVITPPTLLPPPKRLRVLSKPTVAPPVLVASADN